MIYITLDNLINLGILAVAIVTLYFTIHKKK